MRRFLIVTIIFLAAHRAPADLYSNRVANLQILYQAARQFSTDLNRTPPTQLSDLIPYLPTDGAMRSVPNTIRDLSERSGKMRLYRDVVHANLRRPGLQNPGWPGYCIVPSDDEQFDPARRPLIEEIPTSTNEVTLAAFADGGIKQVDKKSSTALKMMSELGMDIPPPQRLTVLVSRDLGLIVGDLIGEMDDLLPMIYRRGAATETEIDLSTGYSYPELDIEAMVGQLTKAGFSRIKWGGLSRPATRKSSFTSEPFDPSNTVRRTVYVRDATTITFGSGATSVFDIPSAPVVRRVYARSIGVSFGSMSLGKVYVRGDDAYGYSTKLLVYLEREGKRDLVLGQVGPIRAMTYFVRGGEGPPRPGEQYVVVVRIAVTRTLKPYREGWLWSDDPNDADVPLVEFAIGDI